MNDRRVYTSPILIARCMDHSTGGSGAHDEYWKAVHPCNIHGEGYRPLDGGVGARNEYWKGVHPCNIHRRGYRPVDKGYGGTR